jgi:hypothetical protein
MKFGRPKGQPLYSPFSAGTKGPAFIRPAHRPSRVRRGPAFRPAHRPCLSARSLTAPTALVTRIRAFQKSRQTFRRVPPSIELKGLVSLSPSSFGLLPPGWSPFLCPNCSQADTVRPLTLREPQAREGPASGVLRCRCRSIFSGAPRARASVMRSHNEHKVPSCRRITG